MDNKEFTWTDALVLEYAVKSHLPQRELTIEEFKKSKIVCPQCGKIHLASKERVCDVDWEILESYRDDINVTHNYIGEGGSYKGSGESCIKHGCKIKSVRRISDNKVFSVGDTVRCTRQSDIFCFEIGEFSIKENDLMASIKNTDSRYNIMYLENLSNQNRNSTPITQERIEVRNIELAMYFGNQDDHCYFIHCTQPIPKEKLPLIKKAIEDCINGECEKEVKWVNWLGVAEQTRSYKTSLEASSFLKNQFDILKSQK